MGDFFAPAATDLVTGMAAEYKQARGWIKQVASFSESDVCKAVIGYFLDGNATDDRGRTSMSASAAQLFRRDGAVAALNAAYWQKALSLTDVYDAMPQDRRNQWNAQIRNPAGVRKHRDSKEWETPPLPDFEEETVRATLQGLLASRAKFLAERVDGIFRALSGEHVTNSPAAFGKRMIIAYLTDEYGYSRSDRVGYINDLRCVIAKFMGRDEPQWNSTSSIVGRARRERRGEWVTLDGGALRLRAYKCGTAHLEVHPDMAWRLNCVLAHLYPLAIPPEFRAKPKKKPKDFVMMGRPLPFAVIAVLEHLETAYNMGENTGPDAWRNKYRRVEIRNALQPRGGLGKGAVADKAERVIAYIGGVKTKNDSGGTYYAFEYDPREVIADIIASGCLPDQKAHQYYPTPANVAEAAIALAEIGPDHTCLEPSAGTGGLADLMPQDRTLCIEISKLHCKVLEAKGYSVVQGDFLRWDARLSDRIVMNPPFSEGRWQAHIEHAAGLLAAGGRLVAILPASARNKDVLPGWACEWSKIYANEFAGTSVDVVILVARRASAMEAA
ncbi:class I SAM-dependent methyltransferase [Azoarcus indigens]|nr:class I SAM-dependent methyltransferase [Azoarcus indigens]